MPEPFSWSRQYQRRRAAAARFGKSVFQLPLRKRAVDVVLDSIGPGARVLEVGAGDRRMQRMIDSLDRDVTYQSVDPDPAGQHDFARLEDIDEQFDCVFALEVIEHVPLAKSAGWLAELFRVTQPGGTLILSTPNTFYPPAFLRDATHVTPWCYDELAGAVDGAGFATERVFRIYNDAAHRYIARRFLFGWLFRLMRIDYSPQIVLVGRREKG